MSLTLSTARSVVAGLLCAALACTYVWLVHPRSRDGLEFWWTAGLIMVFAVPVLLCVWSFAAGPCRRPVLYRWLGFFVRLHLAVMTTIVIAWVGLFGIGSQLSFMILFLLQLDAALTIKSYGFGLFFAEPAMIIDLLVVLLIPRAADEAAIVGLQRIVGSICGGALACLLGWSAVSGVMVAAKAAAIAMDRPYCLQVEADDRGHYRPVRSLFDLSGLKMWSRNSLTTGSQDYVWTYHAVLLTNARDGTHWMNWSYRNQRFMPIGPTPPRLVCRPRKRFAETLPIFAFR